jgi:hypothetical protein
MTERTPIFSRIRPNLAVQIFGIYLLFLAMRIEFDLLSLRIVFVIYIYVCNRVKGLDQLEDHDLNLVSELTEPSVFSSIQ